MIKTDEQALDTILKMVKTTEKDNELALGATVVIWKLVQAGKKDLALEVLSMYKPESEIN